MVQLPLLRFFNAPKFPASMTHEEVLAPATPASSSSSLSSNVSPISISEEIDQESAFPGAAAAVDDQASGHAHGLPPAQSLALESRLPGRGLFSSLTNLFDIYQRGRNAFVDYLIRNPTLHGSTIISRKRKRGDKDGEKEGVIYALLNLTNKKLYVGQTNNFLERMSGHFSSVKKSCIKSAIEKYGRENFVSVILLAGIVKEEELNLTEIVLIKALDCLAPGNRGYNIHPGGRGGAMLNETRNKISNSERGKLVSIETRAKLSASGKGRVHSDERKAAISKAVIITLLKTRLEIPCTSLISAGKEMGVHRQTISNLANKTTKKSTSKGGDYVGQVFTARFRD